MARKFANSLLNSLKGKIRLATVALAFFVCAFGLISYLAASFLTIDIVYVIFVPFLLAALSTVIFGWQLSNEVVRPIEKISLLAKSLERNSLTSFPKTSGARETDELLQTLYRNNQQLQIIVGLMEKVAAGDLDVALAPLENSDRLSSSFQKLLAKAAESIQAKKDLETLLGAINKISSETAPVRHGNFDVEIKSVAPQTREIAKTFEFLIGGIDNLIRQVKTNSTNARGSVSEVKRTVRTAIEHDENKIQRLNQAVLTLKQIPQNVQNILQELSGSASAANQLIEETRSGSLAAQKNSSAVGALRKQIQESVARARRLAEHSQEITQIAKAVGDLARRTNMLALNASIQAVAPDAQSRGILILAEEIERLAARAENADKKTSTLNKSISNGLSEVENSLRATAAEVANLVNLGVKTECSLIEIEKYLGQFLNLQTQLLSRSTEQSTESDAAFQTFVASISETEVSIKNLKKFEAGIVQLLGLIENLLTAVADFKVSENSGEKSAETGEYKSALEIVEPEISV
ncbi:MAG: methyl-accepting chemotaxis protein [Acidobacteriota bacterium]|nr:methyl-accepting chemotaxis protein [Acidobacteriota bacterium]